MQSEQKNGIKRDKVKLVPVNSDARSEGRTLIRRRQSSSKASKLEDVFLVENTRSLVWNLDYHAAQSQIRSDTPNCIPPFR